jgi:malate dehydrogenase (oxaloacetate-decarboxylating)(NADP+)
MFNDDVQGTGAVIVGGFINAIKTSGVPVKDHKAIFLGAGSAGTGVAKQIVEFFKKEGLTEEEARRKFWFVDSNGLVTSDRGDKLADHKVYFASVPVSWPPDRLRPTNNSHGSLDHWRCF